ncbi:PREDICTED: uncharacterized protein LOC104606940 [Nelumbo nucifera]|uniref:Uncharacterized protein LOC104606940 n=1 Tax=Nelumbo nucifera TaxID=4432 RepID=A0A1U8B4I9_NELNU|nr:PREDICTED: uncharacterized protein LOC104606940 [Nelumbo nucifera]
MSKAYDRIEWVFLTTILQKLGFNEKFVKLIHLCISTSSFSILVNEENSNKFYPQRGLRQGDPLCPYLVIMCMSALSLLLSKLVEHKKLSGIKIARGCPIVSHMMFADDLVIFGKNTVHELENVKKALQIFGCSSGQEVNYAKSGILISKNVHHHLRNMLVRFLKVKSISQRDKYLGAPLFIGINKNEVFSSVVKRVCDKLNGWRAHTLSVVGRVAFVNHMVTAIPTYLMSVLSLPITTCDDIEKVMHRFIWGASDSNNFYPTISWQKICLPKVASGLGVRRMKYFNDALLAKVGWRILIEQGSIWVSILKSKHFPFEELL